MYFSEIWRHEICAQNTLGSGHSCHKYDTIRMYCINVIYQCSTLTHFTGLLSVTKWCLFLCTSPKQTWIGHPKKLIQFQMWEKEVNRIVKGPVVGEDNKVKLNTVFIWAGALHRTTCWGKANWEPCTQNWESPRCFKNSWPMFETLYIFPQSLQGFYKARIFTKQKAGKNSTACYSKLIIELHHQAEFPENTEILIMNKLINGCIDVHRNSWSKTKKSLYKLV